MCAAFELVAMWGEKMVESSMEMADNSSDTPSVEANEYFSYPSVAKEEGLPWTVAKGHDTFTPISSILSLSRVPDPHILELWLKSEGQERDFSTFNEDIGESSTSRGVSNSRNTPQPSFPSSSFDMQEQLKNQMKNPAMHEMMSSMMKNISPDMMASMSKQFGYKMSREDGEKAQQAMSSLSPESIDKMFFDLLNIFALNGLPSDENPYLFNGDFVDRGSFSVEVILTLFAFKCMSPSAIKHYYRLCKSLVEAMRELRSQELSEQGFISLKEL
ncbi:unnamed protein product [Lactuca virosa]|uniref:Uncharacterized protein n=1 Tax=Lactuca virosa TaxID=75947 RepID=A0AAU9NNA5_9ASTR|nr:unnamed protein product [Lactuca virosa]